MKKLILLLIAFPMIAIAQNSRTTMIIQRSVNMMDTATVAETWEAVLQNMSRFSKKEKGEWLAHYYAGYASMMLGQYQNEVSLQKKYYEEGLVHARHADSIKPDESEIYALISMGQGLIISTDPQNLGPTLGPETGARLEKAMKLNKDNPRVWLLLGQSQMYTPEQFGGGKNKAIKTLETAIEKYEIIKPATAIHPHWGQKHAQKCMEECKKM